jgi:chromosome segregation ATPase
MWIWWIVSLIVLIACIIFAYRMIVSSYEFLPVDKRYFSGLFKNQANTETGSLQKDSLKVLKNKVQSVEDSSTFYQIQLTKFQQRLKALEDLNVSKVAPEVISKQKEAEKEEDWKEMYFEENEVKEKLENELDLTKQMLEEAKNKLKESLENSFRAVQLQSDYEAGSQDLHSLENEIELLQNQLSASTERERELEQLLLSEITIREKYSMLQKEYVQLQSEADNLRRRMTEINKKDMNLEMRLAHLTELESKLAICEQEKSKLKSYLENRLLG